MQTCINQHQIDVNVQSKELDPRIQFECVDGDGCRKAVLERDTIKIGLAENGGDPAQEGCFFEVDDVEAAAAELRSFDASFKAELQLQKHGDTTYRLFFVIAPDGLCYCIGEAQS